MDSSLVAALAERECVAVGLAGSHDLAQARHAAELLGLSCTEVEITTDEIADALPAVIAAIPKKDPVNTGIALTQFFIARWAGAARVPADHHRPGGGRTLRGLLPVPVLTTALEADLERDFCGLEAAGRPRPGGRCTSRHLPLHALPGYPGRARCRAIPAQEKVQTASRKIPLRKVAAQHIPQELAGYGKKAMQYGSGVWGVLQKTCP